MDEASRQAVRQFVVRACQRAGGQTALARAIAPWHKVGRSLIGQWISGYKNPNAWVLFGIAQQFDLPLLEEPVSIHLRLSVLEAQVAEMRQLLAFIEPPPPPLPDG